MRLANTPPKQERMPLFTGGLKNQHPPQHSPRHPTITPPMTQPDDLLFEVPRFKGLNSCSDEQGGVSGGVWGGRWRNTHPCSFPLYKGVSSNWVGCWAFFVQTIQRPRLLRANYRFGLSKGSLFSVYLTFMR